MDRQVSNSAAYRIQLTYLPQCYACHLPSPTCISPSSTCPSYLVHSAAWTALYFHVLVAGTYCTPILWTFALYTYRARTPLHNTLP